MRTGLKCRLWFHYVCHKMSYASLLTMQTHFAGQVPVRKEAWNCLWKNLFQGKMTYLWQSKGLEMAPTISAEEKLIVRKLPWPKAILSEHHALVNVGDVVVLKDPLDTDNHIVRRLAAVKGYEMVSTNPEDEPFVIEDGQCWVLSDNQKLKPEERTDSRTYGPISMSNIVGRVIYRFRSSNDHGFMKNSTISMSHDMSILFVELKDPEFQHLLKSEDKEDKES